MAIAVAVLLGAGTASAACDGGDSGGGDLTPEAYFERMAEVGAEFNTTGEQLQIAFEDDQANATTEEERIDVLRDFVVGTIEAFETFVDDAGDLEPPDTASAAHGDAVTAATAVRDFLRQVEDDLGDATSEEEAAEIVNLFLESGAPDAFEESCFDLQAVADGEGIDVDLGCSQ